MRDWQRILMNHDESIVRAIEILNEESLRIALVVDENNKLIGTVTDGDIRRGLIKHFKMDDPISHVVHTTPRTASLNDDRGSILVMMKEHDLLQVPILDGEGIVVGLETLQDLIAKPHYENPVFLMAGGFGKRLRPLTIETPKPLLKVGGKPILQTILESFVHSGFHNFYISTHYKAEMLRAYFGDGNKWGISIEYVHEEKPLGTAGALGLLPQGKFDKSIIMMNGDLLTNIDHEQLLKYHDDLGGIATMCVREYDFQVPYGVVTTEKNRVKNIVEKPVHNFFVNAGIYVISPELPQKVSKNRYTDMPDLLQEQITMGEQVNMFPMHEYWLDIGRLEDFEQVQGQ
jgi:dTDP-glucose pyrophosphorylase